MSKLRQNKFLLLSTATKGKRLHVANSYLHIKNQIKKAINLQRVKLDKF